MQNSLIIWLGIGRPPGQMDPKAFLLQKFNATARERVSCGYMLLNMLDYSVINPYVQHNVNLIRIPKPVHSNTRRHFGAFVKAVWCEFGSLLHLMHEFHQNLDSKWITDSPFRFWMILIQVVSFFSKVFVCFTTSGHARNFSACFVISVRCLTGLGCFLDWVVKRAFLLSLVVMCFCVFVQDWCRFGRGGWRIEAPFI